MSSYNLHLRCLIYVWYRPWGQLDTNALSLAKYGDLYLTIGHVDDSFLEQLPIWHMTNNYDSHAGLGDRDMPCLT